MFCDDDVVGLLAVESEYVSQSLQEVQGKAKGGVIVPWGTHSNVYEEWGRCGDARGDNNSKTEEKGNQRKASGGFKGGEVSGKNNGNEKHNERRKDSLKDGRSDRLGFISNQLTNMNSNQNDRKIRKWVGIAKNSLVNGGNSKEGRPETIFRRPIVDLSSPNGSNGEAGMSISNFQQANHIVLKLPDTWSSPNNLVRISSRENSRNRASARIFNEFLDSLKNISQPITQTQSKEVSVQHTTREEDYSSRQAASSLKKNFSGTKKEKLPTSENLREKFNNIGNYSSPHSTSLMNKKIQNNKNIIIETKGREFRSYDVTESYTQRLKRQTGKERGILELSGRHCLTNADKHITGLNSRVSSTGQSRDRLSTPHDTSVVKRKKTMMIRRRGFRKGEYGGGGFIQMDMANKRRQLLSELTKEPRERTDINMVSGVKWYDDSKGTMANGEKHAQQANAGINPHERIWYTKTEFNHRETPIVYPFNFKTSNESTRLQLKKTRNSLFQRMHPKLATEIGH